MIEKVIQGDNLEVLKTFPDNSIDSVVTDPPYGLGKEPNATELLKDWVEKGYHEISGRGFMGKEWDAFVPQPNFWKEIYRVLKPGGYVLSFAGTRTYDWMVMAVRLAGFEIRDMIAWLYSTGFPKALDIEKQLKKMLVKFVNSGIMDVGDNNENRNEWKISNEQKTEHNLRPLWEEYLQKTEFNEEEFRKILQSFMSEQGLQISRNSTCDVWREQPSMEGWSDDEEKQGELQGREIRSMSERIYRDVKERWIYNGTSFSDGETFESDIEKVGSGSPHRPQSKQQRYKEFDALFIKWRTQKIRSITEKIKEISGWKTSLKPALEPIVMARKPLIGTVAENVMKYGTGGINIDECRVGEELMIAQISGKTSRAFQSEETTTAGGKGEDKLGRFPANVIHDGSDEVVSLFPNTKSSSGSFKADDYKQGGTATPFTRGDFEGYGDSGNASRFFYTAKASQSERNYGLGKFETKIVGSLAGGESDKDDLDDVSSRFRTSKKNIHPTVKPVELMRYLVKLVTPKGGVCLDPFLGSGTTAVACKLEKFQYVGIELIPEYAEIAEARIKAEVVKYDIFDFMD